MFRLIAILVIIFAINIFKSYSQNQKVDNPELSFSDTLALNKEAKKLKEFERFFTGEENYELVQQFKEVFEIVNIQSCQKEEAKSFYYLALLDIEKRDFDNAYFKLKKAMELWDEGNDLQKGRGICKLGLINIKRGKWNEGLSFFNHGADILMEAKDHQELSVYCNEVAIYCNKKLSFDTSRIYLNKAFKLLNKTGSPEKQSIILTNIGNTYFYQHNYPDALKHYQMSITMAEETKDNKALALAANSIGNVYMLQGKYSEALVYYDKSKSSYEELEMYEGVANCNINIGNIYKMQNKPNEALAFFKLALEVYEANNMRTNMSIVLSNIGVIYDSEGNYIKAKEYYERALQIDKERGDMQGMCYSYYNLASVNENLNNLVAAANLYLECAKIANNSNEINVLKECYLSLSNLYEEQNNPHRALYYYKSYTLMKDSILGLEKTKQLNELNTRFETERKEKEIVLLKQKESVQERELQKKQMLMLAISVVSVLLLLLTAFIYRAFLMKRKHQRILELKNVLIKQQKEKIAEEKRKADNWIIDYLPNEKADEVKQAGRATEKHYEILSHVISNLEQEKMKFEMSALQSAVNPHFLYNTLNILTSLIEENPKLSIDFVNSLSGVYKYVTNCNNNEIAELGEELAFVKSYLHLLSYKYGKNFEVKWNVDKGLYNHYLPSLTLQLLLENIMKHNVINESRPLFVEVYNISDEVLAIKNNRQPKIESGISTKIGLANIKDRYSMLTDREVNIIKTESIFQVEIPLLEI